MSSSLEMTKLAVKCLEDKKAENIQVIDINEISSIGDYFVIAGGNNRSQIQAVADHIQETLGKAGYQIKQVEGYNKANWVLLDYRDVIIHIFDIESRNHYDLERLWRDGVKIDINEL